MTSDMVTISIHGVLDHARAETIAARIRAAIRHGKRNVVLSFDAGTVIASQAFLGFLLRATALLRTEHGTLTLTGDQMALEPLRAMQIDVAISGDTKQGDAL